MIRHKKIIAVIFTLLSLLLLSSCSKKEGDPSFYIDENGNVIVEYANGKQQTIGNVKPGDSEKPKSITNAELNASGELILTFSDGTTLNLGAVKDPSPRGTDGTGDDRPAPGTVTITGAQIVNGSLVLTFSNGHSVTVGKLETTEGKKIQSISLSDGVWRIRYSDGSFYPPEPSSSDVTTEQPTEVLYRQTGRAESKESQYLTLWADWEAVTYDGKTATVTVKVGLTSYAIEVGKRAGDYAGTVTVNGETRHFDTPAISHMTDKQKSFRFVEYTFQISLDQDSAADLNIQVTWPFNGTYHGKEIGTLKAADSVAFPGGSSGSEVLPESGSGAPRSASDESVPSAE